MNNQNMQEVNQILNKLQNNSKALNAWKNFLNNIQHYIQQEWLVEGYNPPTITELTLIINPFIMNSNKLSILASILNENELTTLFKFMIFGIHNFLKNHK